MVKQLAHTMDNDYEEEEDQGSGAKPLFPLHSLPNFEFHDEALIEEVLLRIIQNLLKMKRLRGLFFFSCVGICYFSSFVGHYVYKPHMGGIF